MKILVVGATGTIGSAIARLLSGHHQIIAAGHTRGEVQVDLGERASIENLFHQVGTVDAVISAAGLAAFGGLEELSDDQFALSVGNKLMGQVNLVRIGLPHIGDGGSITLTSGILARDPIPGSAAISMVNAGLEAFCRAAALEMPRGIRINVVSPGWIKETLEAMGRDGSAGVPADAVVSSYAMSLEGDQSGAVISVPATP